MRTLIIIPAYNEVKNVPTLITNITKNGYDYIVINDCSTDDSKQVYDKLNIKCLNLPINLGLASVTQVGCKYACEHNYDCAVVVDGDGQHPPKYIKYLVEKIEQGYDYAIGSRYVNEKKPWTLRMIGSRIICFFIKLKTGKKYTDPTSGMRAMGKNVINLFANSLNYIAEPDALVHLQKKGYKIIEIQVEMEDRSEGESYFANPLKTIKFMFNVLMSIIFVQ